MAASGSAPRRGIHTGELALIQKISEKARVSNRSVRLGIGDDCAILRVQPGEELVLTTDFSLEGRHFRRDWHPPRSIGHRTLARGLSDIGAMGARPLAAFLSLALPPQVARDKRWVDAFLDGMLLLAREHGVPLAGGDLAEAHGDGVLADIVLTGAAPAGKALRRSTAKPGDLLYVTGALGGAAAELTALAYKAQRVSRARTAGEHPHLFPQPRVRVGRALLRRTLATACIDVSDGLSTDLVHLCEASGVGAEVDSGSLPLHPASKRHPEAERLQLALHGGEDYELLFTARPSTPIPRTLVGIPVSLIGRIVRGHRVTLIGENGQRAPLAAGGWEHFRP